MIAFLVGLLITLSIVGVMICRRLTEIETKNERLERRIRLLQCDVHELRNAAAGAATAPLPPPPTAATAESGVAHAAAAPPVVENAETADTVVTSLPAGVDVVVSAGEINAPASVVYAPSASVFNPPRPITVHPITVAGPHAADAGGAEPGCDGVARAASTRPPALPPPLPHDRLDTTAVDPAAASQSVPMWQRLEQTFVDNWTGILGSAVMVAGVGFIGVYGALKVSPGYCYRSEF